MRLSVRRAGLNYSPSDSETTMRKNHLGILLLAALAVTAYSPPSRADMLLLAGNTVTGGSPAQILRHDEKTGAYLGVFATYNDGLGTGLAIGPNGDIFASNEVSYTYTDRLRGTCSAY